MSSDSPPLATSPDSDHALRHHSTLEQLWESAVARYRKEHDKDGTTLELYRAVRSQETNTLSELVDSCSKHFAEFRGIGGKPKDLLGRLVKILLVFSEASADATGAAIPGGKFIIAAVAGLLKAVDTVSETYDAIECVLEKIKTTLQSYESVLGSTVPISVTLSARIVTTLVAVLDFLGTVTTHCRVGIVETKKKWAKVLKERLKDFGAAILKDPKVSDKSRALDKAITAEDKQLLAETHKSVRDVMNMVHSLFRGQEYAEIKTWIAPPDHSTTYTNHLDKKHEDTCNWILDEESFRDWKYRYASFYEILGKAGSGKSVLCSRIVEHLLDNTDDSPTFSLAYFFFDATIPTQRSHRALLSSILFQVACSSEACWERLRAEYNRFGRSGPPAIKKLSTMLVDLLEVSGPTCIVIDALDECQTTNNDQISTLKSIIELQRPILPAVHILVTSRPEHRITLHLKTVKEKTSLNLASNKMHYRDLEAYVSACLDSAEYDTVEWSSNLRESVRAKLCSVEKSEGVFLWVELQLRILCDTLPRNIPAKLDTLPQDLAGTFRGILDRFSGDSPVREILGLIAVAERPLTVQEVAAAFAFDFERGAVHASRLSDDDQHQHQVVDAKAYVVRYLPSLVEVRIRQNEWEGASYKWEQESNESEEESNGWETESHEREKESTVIETVHFIHFSVKEYLTGGGPISDTKPPPQYLIDSSIASLHMATLSLVALTDSPPLQSFAPYADEWWFHHVELAVIKGELDFVDKEDMDARCPEARNLNQALLLFFDHLADEWKKPPSQFFRRTPDSQECARIRSGRQTSGRRLAVPLYQLLPPLHMAVELGLAGHVERLLTRDPNVDVTGDMDAPLPPAYRMKILGQRQSFRFLPDELSSVTSLFWAVSCCSREAQLRTIGILLDRGAGRISDGAWSYESLMHQTTLAPNKDLVIGHFVARGVDIDARDSAGLTSLHRAASRVDIEWLKALLAHGANPNTLDAEGKTPLVLACVGGGRYTKVVDTVRALLEAGADADLHGPGTLTALQWTAVYDERESRDLCLRAGANADGLTEMKELGAIDSRADQGASETMVGRLWDLEKKRRLRYAEGLPPLSLSEQRELLHPPPELVKLPHEYWRSDPELALDDPDLVRYWGPN